MKYFLLKYLVFLIINHLYSSVYAQKLNYYDIKLEKKIVKGIKKTEDSKNKISLNDFQPDPTGKTDSRPAFLAALKQCEASGGCVLTVTIGLMELCI
jgi:polygalacturonase